MRSFIKAHRKADSLGSDKSDEINNNQVKTPTTTPNFPSHPQFTPPFQNSSHSRSSPKKLLTPIRNFFSTLGQNAKSSPVGSSADRLSEMIQSGPPPNIATKQRLDKDKKKMKAGSFTNMSYLANRSQENDEHEVADIFPRDPQDSRNRTGYRISSSSGSLFDDKTSKISLTQQQSSTASRHDPFVAPISQESLPQKVELLRPLSIHEGSFSNESKNSLENSLNNFKASGVSFLTPKYPKRISHNSDNEDDLDSHDDASDASSQFSFVRDKRGGRNTSVKYYKTKASQNELGRLALMDENDFGSDADAYSDYDFENNGMDGEDIFDSEDDDEDVVNYNPLFDDDEVVDLEPPLRELVTSEQSMPVPITPDLLPTATKSLFTNSPPTHTLKRHKFYKSYHLSIEGLDDIETLPSPDAGDDILENYLELAHDLSPRLNIPESTPEFNSNHSLELFDLSSPLINGVTIGNNLEHRFGSIRSEAATADTRAKKMFIHRHDSQLLGPSVYSLHSMDGKGQELPKLRAFHGSIDHGINTALEEKANEFDAFQRSQQHSQTPKTAKSTELHGLGLSMEDLNSSRLTDRTEQLAPNNTKLSIHRTTSSITRMMDFLGGASDVSVPKQAVVKNKRESVESMMNSLAFLESSQTEISAKEVNEKQSSTLHFVPLKPNVKRTVSGKRYSWCSEASQEDDGYPAGRGAEDTGAQRRQNDDELLDEINQIPEDYEFDKRKTKTNTMPHLTDDWLWRSSSFNKRPVKAIMDYKMANNKIETGGKTVTFYRNNSLNKDMTRSRSVSRAPSARSMTSFVSVDEESEEAEEAPKAEANDSVKKPELLDDLLSRAEVSSGRRSLKLLDKRSELERSCSPLDSIKERDFT